MTPQALYDETVSLEVTRTYSISENEHGEHDHHYEFVGTNLWIVKEDNGWRLHQAHRYPAHRSVELPWLQQYGLLDLTNPSFRELVRLVREIDAQDPIPRSPYVIDGRALQKTATGYASRDGRFLVYRYHRRVRKQDCWVIVCTHCNEKQYAYGLRSARHQCENHCSHCLQ
jgi:hypothetical protein